VIEVHETSLMKGLLRQVDALATEQGAIRVIGLSVWLGALTQMSARHFMVHFKEASAGTIAEHAAVQLEVSDDPWHANAQDVLLQSIEVES